MYSLLCRIQVTQRNVNPVIHNVSKTSVMIRLTKTQAVDSTGIFTRNIDRGYTGQIRPIQNGIPGTWKNVSYGDTEILFQVLDPNFPYSLEFIPGYYLWDYTLEVHVSSPNPRFNKLMDSWGLTNEQINVLPNQLLEILMVLDPSKSADTRNIVRQLEANSLATAANTGAIQQTQAELVLATDEMVQNREYSVAQTDFTQVGDAYVALVTHDLTGAVPQMSLIDAEKEEQGFSQLIASGIDKIKVELSATQYANSSFPFVLTVQGKKSAASMAGTWKAKPLSDRFYRLLNGTIDRSADGSTVENAALLTQITEAFMSGTSQLIFWKNSDGQVGTIDNGSLGNAPIALPLVEYEAAKALADSVML